MHVRWMSCSVQRLPCSPTIRTTSLKFPPLKPAVWLPQNLLESLRTERSSYLRFLCPGPSPALLHPPQWSPPASLRHRRCQSLHPHPRPPPRPLPHALASPLRRPRHLSDSGAPFLEREHKVDLRDHAPPVPVRARSYPRHRHNPKRGSVCKYLTKYTGPFPQQPALETKLSKTTFNAAALHAEVVRCGPKYTDSPAQV